MDSLSNIKAINEWAASPECAKIVAKGNSFSKGFAPKPAKAAVKKAK
jgi:hypothetical protein